MFFIDGTFPNDNETPVFWYVGNNPDYIKRILSSISETLMFCPALAGQTLRSFFESRFWKEDITKFKFWLDGKNTDSLETVLKMEVLITIHRKPKK